MAGRLRCAPASCVLLHLLPGAAPFCVTMKCSCSLGLNAFAGPCTGAAPKFFAPRSADPVLHPHAPCADCAARADMLRRAACTALPSRSSQPGHRTLLLAPSQACLGRVACAVPGGCAAVQPLPPCRCTHYSCRWRHCCAHKPTRPCGSRKRSAPLQSLRRLCCCYCLTVANAFLVGGLRVPGLRYTCGPPPTTAAPPHRHRIISAQEHEEPRPDTPPQRGTRPRKVRMPLRRTTPPESPLVSGPEAPSTAHGACLTAVAPRHPCGVARACEALE